MSLAEKGYDVSIIVQDEYENETLNGVKIISSNYKPKNRFDRIISIRRFLWPRIIETQADIYQIHDPDLLFVGLKLTKLGRKVIYDCHEPYDTNTYPYLPLGIGRILARIYGLLEKKIVCHFSGVATVNEVLVEKFKDINLNTALVTNFPIINKCDNNNLYQTNSDSMCYAGGISEGWNIGTLIECLHDVPDVFLNLAGFGDIQYLNNLKQKKGWEKVNYFGKLPYEEIPKFIAESGIGAALLKYSETENNLTGGTIGNTKLFEYMRAGIPVIATDFPNWVKIVEKENCGICVNPSDKKQITEAIGYLVSNPIIAKMMGNNGKQAIQTKYNWDIQLNNLEKLYQAILQQ